MRCAPTDTGNAPPDDTGLDAALLLPPVRGLLPADDPRTRATLRAYTENLTSDHYAYRFRHDERPLEEAEGAFLLCGFVTALAEHHQGRKAEAYRWFERNRHACGAAGLYSDEYDIASGSCAATCRRPSSTLSCSKPPPRSPVTHLPDTPA
ncbi:glycoside hydrolase family 15 protein [Streptomyces mirabilis]|uniref:glycoside hydrolase family 15 protein n=1 Tax=Streptomyces mirabilis TaxID=68239 RepID=UPI0033AEA901